MKLLCKNKQACLAFVLLSGAFLGTPSQAESKFSIADGKTTTMLPFELIDNRVFVEAQLNGRGPFHFILDTGAGGFSIVDDVAQRLGLQVEDAGQGSARVRLRGVTLRRSTYEPFEQRQAVVGGESSQS